jgi:thiol-disulfide isomerase/thioredoxin
MRWALGVALVATLAACASPAPGGDATLLFLGRAVAARAGGLSWAPDPDHSRLIGFDGRLHAVKAVTNPGLQTPVAVAALGASELLITERTGEAVVFDTLGRLVREWQSPDVASLYAASGARVAAVRSPYYVPELATPEPDTAPLVRMLDTSGRAVAGLATIRVPALALLSYLVNAGAVAVGPDGAVYYAPLVRDEITKYAPDGAVRWTVQRGLFPASADPVFLPAKGRELVVRKALVNVALALGPPGRLYSLGALDSAATRLRVDVLDTATGKILTTREIGSRERAVVADSHGALALLDRDSLIAAAAPCTPGAREPFAPAFALPDLHDDTIPLARFAGAVTLVSFWASWCDPCREEFPHMADLYGRFPRKDFQIVAISDDVDHAKMLAFVQEFRPPFPILVGGGRMKELYHYRGLPYAVLLDRRGRIIERIFGFGGTEEFQALRDTIAKEVRAP